MESSVCPLPYWTKMIDPAHFTGDKHGTQRLLFQKKINLWHKLKAKSFKEANQNNKRCKLLEFEPHTKQTLPRKDPA